MLNGQVKRRTSRRRVLAAAIATALTGGQAVGAAAAPLRAPHPFFGSAADAGEIIVAMTTNHLAKTQATLDRYQKRSGVTVRAVAFSRDDLYTELTISLTQQTGAYDVISVDDAWLPQYVAGDLLSDLSERFVPVSPGVEFDVVSAFQTLGSDVTGERQFAVPWVGDVKLFGWRVAALEQVRAAVPVTLNDVLDVARRIAATGGAPDLYGYGVPRQAGSPLAMSFLSTLWAFGGDILDPETQEPQLESAAASQAMDLFLRLVALAPPERADVEADNAANFRSGSVAMTSDIWPDDLFALTDESGSGSEAVFGAGPSRTQGRGRGGSLTAAWLFAVPAQSQRSTAAMDFIAWMTSPSVQKTLLLESRLAPTRRTVLQDAEANQRYPFLSGLYDAAQTARPRSRSPYYPGLEIILVQCVQDAVSGERAADDALRRANQEMRALLLREGVLS